MKKIALLSIALFLLAASTAVAQDVRYNFDKNADFSKFKTYKWLTVRDSSKVDDRWDKRIEDVMDLESFVHLRTHIWRSLREEKIGAAP